MKKNTKIILAVVGGLLALCVVCLGIAIIYNQTPRGRAEVTERAIAKVTEAAIPTLTPRPSDTPAPTATQAPTDTPVPTLTPTETLTPTQPPEPVILTGSGDNVVDFENPFTVAIVHIIGNSSGVYFGVTSYNADGEQIDLLVNTTESYEGIRPLDFKQTHTTRFEIQAEGEWTIEVLPITRARISTIPGTIEGAGDEVIFLAGGEPDIATIMGNEAGSYFGVFSYGDTKDILVNETEPYSGKVPMNGDTIALEIVAIGAWKIEISTK